MNIIKKSRRTLALCTLGIAALCLASCSDGPAEMLAPLEHHKAHANLSYDNGCWPVGENNCEDRMLSNDEWWRIYNSISLIPGGAECDGVRDMLEEDLWAEKIRFWTNGPSNYNPDNYYGDRHMSLA